MKRPNSRANLASSRAIELEEPAVPEKMEDDAECDDYDEAEELLMGPVCGPTGLGDKKRRLAIDQVRALERNFEVDNKLDPDRKARLARELGLQPRQVAVWFQNRRARWKTKQLERDFGALRARHDELRAECDALRRDKDALAAEIRELRAKVEKSQMIVKMENIETVEERPTTMIHKDGSSDTDSSVVFNDDASPYSGATVLDHQLPFMGFSSFIPLSSTTSFPMFETKVQSHIKSFMEEGFLGSDELVGSSGGRFFAEEQVSNISWYGPEGWQ